MSGFYRSGISDAVLLSIRPQWCDLIVNGVKTVEVRKSKPKLKCPFKCYIYCTKYTDVSCKDADINNSCRKGLIIGEFMCDKIATLEYCTDNTGTMPSHQTTSEFCGESSMCLSWDKVSKYLGHQNGYGWHISNLIVYEEPKNISEFYKPCIDKYGYCPSCSRGYVYQSYDMDYENGECEWVCLNHYKRPPSVMGLLSQFS